MNQYPDNVNMKPSLASSQPGTNEPSSPGGGPSSSAAVGQAQLNATAQIYGSFPAGGGGGTAGSGGSMTPSAKS